MTIAIIVICIAIMALAFGWNIYDTYFRKEK